MDKIILKRIISLNERNNKMGTKKVNSMITGTGHHLPKKIVTNQDLEKMIDTSDEWITKMVGIKQRHYVGDSGEVTSDLATNAARMAIEDAGLTPDDIDAILLGTVSGDMTFPSTAIFVQKKLGAKNATAMDISAACTGFIYGLEIADGFIASGKYKHVLVIGVEVLTSILNMDDRATAVIFGDGAGAAVLSASDGERGILGSYTKSDGSLAELLWSKGGGTYEKADPEDIENREKYIRMEGNKVFKHAVRAMIDSADNALERAGMTGKDIDLLIPHQANLRIIDAIAKRVNLTGEKVFVNLDKVGNTSAASIPIAIDQARKSGRLKKGDNLLIAAFGGGFTWGGAVIKM